MFLSQADKQAAHDGFKFLVLSPSGARKCYCTTVKEAKAEAGKGGKIVSLGRMRYTTQNPRKRNPSARMVGLQRNPTVAVWDEPVVIGFKSGQKLFREKVPFPHPMYSSVKDMVADLYGGNPNIDEIKVLLNGKQYSYSLYKHGVGRAVASKTKAKKNSAARKRRNPKGKGMVPFSELAVGDRFKFGGDKCKKISKTKFQIEASGPFPATTVAAQPWYNVEPLSKRNPTWTTAAILAGGAYIYGRSAKVREKIKGAIDSAHKKLENPTARMVGMQRNPSQRTPLQRFYLVDHDSMLLVGKFSRRESARKKANNLVARDPELRGMKLASEHDLSILRQGQKVW